MKGVVFEENNRVKQQMSSILFGDTMVPNIE